MTLRHGIYRLPQWDVDELQRYRQFAEEASDVLKQFPKPDTFIGRKTQEPFPNEEDG